MTHQTTIAVIGANGRSGKAFVAAALRSGHTVRAGIHSGSLNPHKNLTSIKIDATNSSDIAKLLKSSDVVVSLIGHTKGSPASLQTDTMKIVVAEMKKLKIRRIISLTGTGVRFPNDKITLADMLLHQILKRVMPNIIHDGKEHAKVLQKSSLDWTIIRALVLTNGESRIFKLKPHGPAKLLAPRKEIAEAILEVIKDQSFIHEAPMLGR